jgi:hypothetical protein
VAVSIFVYQQPSRLPVITSVKSVNSAYPSGGRPHAPAVSKTPTPEIWVVAALAGAERAITSKPPITTVSSANR